MTSHAPRAWWLETELYARIVPPPPRFTRQPQKEKMFLAFRICAGVIFLKWKGHFSFWGSALQVFRQVAEQCGLGFAKTIFWGKDFAKHSANLF